MARRAPLVAGGGGMALLVALWLPWFSRRLPSGIDLGRLRSDESGWDVLGGAAGAVVAGVAVLGLVWALRPARPLSGTWVVAAGALALIVTVEATTSRLEAVEDAAVVTVSPGFGLLVAYAGGAAVLLAGVAALLAYARERARSG